MTSEHVKQYDRRIKTLSGNRVELSKDIKRCAKWITQAHSALPKVQAITVELKAIDKRSKAEDGAYGKTVADLVRVDEEEKKLEKSGKLDDKKKAELEARRAKLEKQADAQLEKIKATSRELQTKSDKLSGINVVALKN